MDFKTSSARSGFFIYHNSTRYRGEWSVLYFVSTSKTKLLQKFAKGTYLKTGIYLTSEPRAPNSKLLTSRLIMSTDYCKNNTIRRPISPQDPLVVRTHINRLLVWVDQHQYTFTSSYKYTQNHDKERVTQSCSPLWRIYLKNIAKGIWTLRNENKVLAGDNTNSQRPAGNNVGGYLNIRLR